MAKTLLFHVSDIHFGLENNEALDWFSAEVTRLRPAAIAITGDLTMRARHHEFRAAEEWIGTLDAPVTLKIQLLAKTILLPAQSVKHFLSKKSLFPLQRLGL